MKTSKNVMLYTLVIVLALFFSSCSSDDEPSLSKVQVEMKASSSLSTMNSTGRQMATGLIFNQVLVGVTELEFETLDENQAEQEQDDLDGEDGNGEDENEEVEYKGSYIVDLLNGTVTPDLGIADLAPGLYEEVEINLGPVLDNGNTIFIAFEYPTAGGDTVQVEYSSTEEFELEIKDNSGLQLDGSSIHKVIVEFDLDALFSSIDLSQAVADADGVIRINENSNSEIADMVKGNTEDSAGTGEDKDGDDEIDND